MGFRSSSGGDRFGDHESHLDKRAGGLRSRGLSLHEHRRGHGNFLFALVGPANVAEQFHETATGIASPAVSPGRRQHQVGILADLKLALGEQDLVFRGFVLFFVRCHARSLKKKGVGGQFVNRLPQSWLVPVTCGDYTTASATKAALFRRS